MKNKDITFLMLYILVPLAMIFFIAPLLSGCSAGAIRVSEEVIEEVAKEELEANK